jgi:SlyX protein
MTAPDATDQRLTELEIKASFQEDLLDQLNQVIVRQQQDIAQLLRDMDTLRQQAQQAADAGPGLLGDLRDELPPHY